MALDVKEHYRLVEDRLLTMAGLPPVHWPNQDFKPPADLSPYLVVAHIGVQPERITHSGSHRLRDLTQITVVTAQHVGNGPSLSLATQIVAHFPSDLILTGVTNSVRVSQIPLVANGFEADGRWRVPVTIFHETLARG